MPRKDILEKVWVGEYFDDDKYNKSFYSRWIFLPLEIGTFLVAVSKVNIQLSEITYFT